MIITPSNAIVDATMIVTIEGLEKTEDPMIIITVCVPEIWVMVDMKIGITKIKINIEKVNNS